MVPRRPQPDPLAGEVGRRVRGPRIAKGWNLEKLRWAGGLSSEGHLSELENGRLIPAIATLQSIADQLGVELLDLVTFPKQSPRHQLVARTAQLPLAVVQENLGRHRSRRGPVDIGLPVDGGRRSRPPCAHTWRTIRRPRGRRGNAWRQPQRQDRGVGQGRAVTSKKRERGAKRPALFFPSVASAATGRSPSA
jgi:transcriptional regulator with XRE-family HTH domain